MNYETVARRKVHIKKLKEWWYSEFIINPEIATFSATIDYSKSIPPENLRTANFLYESQKILDQYQFQVDRYVFGNRINKMKPASERSLMIAFPEIGKYQHNFHHHILIAVPMKSSFKWFMNARSIFYAHIKVETHTEESLITATPTEKYYYLHAHRYKNPGYNIHNYSLKIKSEADTRWSDYSSKEFIINNDLYYVVGTNPTKRIH